MLCGRARLCLNGRDCSFPGRGVAAAATDRSETECQGSTASAMLEADCTIDPADRRTEPRELRTREALACRQDEDESHEIFP